MNHVPFVCNKAYVWKFYSKTEMCAYPTFKQTPMIQAAHLLLKIFSKNIGIKPDSNMQCLWCPPYMTFEWHHTQFYKWT